MSRAIQRGDRVGIPKGTQIVVDLRPGRHPQPAKRDFEVTVHHILSRERVPFDPTSREDTIRWPGSGGYWRECFASDAVLLDNPDPSV